MGKTNETDGKAWLICLYESRFNISQNPGGKQEKKGDNSLHRFYVDFGAGILGSFAVELHLPEMFPQEKD